jgi:uncharacterized hydrophobic protein (TIGR00271 family)
VSEQADRGAKIKQAKEQLAQRDPAAPIESTRTWWHRRLEPEERQRILAELGIKRQEHWAFRFFTMMSLSVVVAVMGLSADSAAVVIGAMLLAPLMQPVLASAACISMALFQKALRSLGIVLIATVGAVIMSYVLAALFVNGELPQEVTSRTAPDIRDLVVALGAGTAGAYATVRQDVSSSLPGVAVAVALVPPLGTVGITLQAGEGTLAQGALLLYVTNLAAIVLAASIVFVVTGFVPPRRLANTFPRTLAVGTAVAIVVVAIAVPLYGASRSAVEASSRQLEASEVVDDWLDQTETTEPPTIAFEEQRILVRIRSFESPIDQGSLTEVMQARFGSDKVVSVEWDKVSSATTTVVEAPTTTIPSDAELLAADVERIVDQWLQSGEFDGIRRVEALVIGGGIVRVDASGVGEAPQVSELTALLDAELDETLVVQLTWVERRNVPASEPEPTPVEVLGNRISALAAVWADANDATILSTDYDGTTALVEVAGERQPDATDLVRDIRELLPDSSDVTVLFTQRFDITTTTTTTLLQFQNTPG